MVTIRHLMLAAIIPLTTFGLAACSDSDESAETEASDGAAPAEDTIDTMATDVGSGDGATSGAGSSNPGVETDGGESDPITGETQPENQ